MALKGPSGFVECRHLGGATCPSTLTFPIGENEGRSSQFKKYAREPAILTSGRYIGRASADNSGAKPLIGIIRAIYTDSGNMPKPTTFNMPVAGPVLNASVAGWADVNVDPFQTYVAATDTTALGTNIGQFCGTTVGAANTVAGISGFMIKIASCTNAANGDVPFQIIGFAPSDLERRTSKAGTNGVEVRIAHHVFNAPFVGASAAIR